MHCYLNSLGLLSQSLSLLLHWLSTSTPTLQYSIDARPKPYVIPILVPWATYYLLLPSLENPFIIVARMAATLPPLDDIKTITKRSGERLN